MAARRGSLPGEAPGLVWSARCESTCGDETALARASTFSFEQAPEEAPLGPVEARPLVDPMVRPAVAAATELPVPAADGSTLLLAPSPVPQEPVSPPSQDRAEANAAAADDAAEGRAEPAEAGADDAAVRLVPLASGPSFKGTVESNNGSVSIAVREAPLNSVLSLLAQQQGLSIVASSDLTQTITVTLQPTALDDALDALLAVANCTWMRRNDVIYVTPVSKDKASSPFFQGREVRVFTLNYAAAADIEKVITGLLSPVGKVFIREVNATDRRRTIEQLVVEDMPEFLERAAQYIAQADAMPRQVMVEAHILQVKLGKDRSHGVNFDGLARLSGARLQLWNKGLSSDAGPGMVFTVDGTDFNGLIDCLTSTTDAKTLASPKVFAVNGQESRIQIGQRLGYFVTTTTQTSTMQDVRFLETGIVLTVTPYITDDGQVLMRVQPKVSKGEINPETSLPEEETTEVETSILVPGGQGIIIGGLIQETDIEHQSKLSYLGDLWVVGRLFQRRTIDKERNEVIVALLPRIVDCPPCTGPTACTELERATTPLLRPHLDEALRPWEPVLPDAGHRPMLMHRGCTCEPESIEGEAPGPLPPPREPEPAVELLPPTAPDGVRTTEMQESIPWSPQQPVRFRPQRPSQGATTAAAVEVRQGSSASR